MLLAADVTASHILFCEFSNVFVQAHIQRGHLLLIRMVYQFVSETNKCNVGNVCLRSNL